MASVQFGLGQFQMTSKATAATTDLVSGVPTIFVRLTSGTGPITSFGTSINKWRVVYVNNPVTISHSGAGTAGSIFLPTQADIAAQAGDHFMARSDAGGAWQVMLYQRGDGTPLVMNFAPLSGTWTPTFAFATPGDSVITYTAQVGTYLKLGSCVLVAMDIGFITNAYTTPSGIAQFGGFPFPAALMDGSLAIGSMSNVTFNGATQELTMGIPIGASYATLRNSTTNTLFATFGVTAFLASKSMRIRASGLYWV